MSEIKSNIESDICSAIYGEDSIAEDVEQIKDLLIEIKDQLQHIGEHLGA